MRIVRDVYRMDGNIGEAELCLVDGKLQFLQYFQQASAEVLEWESEAEMLLALDRYRGESPLLYLTDDELWYVESEGDRQMKYFGSVVGA